MKDTRNIATLKGWDKNPRSIKDKDFERLKKQIYNLGQYKPLLITEDGTVLGGNMRLRAYKELAIEDIWVSVVDAPTEEKKLEYALSDNDRAGYYDDDLLANLIPDYPQFEWGDYAVDMKEPQNLQALIDSFAPDTQEDEAPPLPREPESKLGEVYQLGRHRLMCGDATNIEHVETLMDGQKADMVLTDPPYGMFLDADFSSMKSSLKMMEDKGITGGNKYEDVIGDHGDFNPDFINTIFSYFSGVKEIFLWGANYYTELLLDRNKGSWFVWDKRLDESSDRMYGSCFELCWSKQKHKQDMVRIKWAGVFGTEQEFDKKRSHPTQKPVALSAYFIEKYSEPEQLIVDLFGGSGSALIAAEQTNRSCFMMELDPKYCDVIRKRYENYVQNNTGNRT